LILSPTSMSETRSMARYVVRRLLQGIPTIFVIIILNFLLIHLAPGDPTYLLLGAEVQDQALIDRIRATYGLDKPLYEQLGIYVAQVLQGNLGESYWYRAPVSKLILDRLPATLLLMGSALLFAVVFGIVFGVTSSRRPYSLVDSVLSTFSVVGYSIPLFWLGQVLIIVFSLWLGLLPFGGFTSVPTEQIMTGEGILDVLRHLVLPAFALGTAQLALIYRLTRANMLETLGQDYIIAARAKGLDENAVVYGHALRNCLLPIVTVIGMNTGFMFAGAVLTETVFTWPGLGRLMFDSLLRRDYPVVMGDFIFMSVMIIIIILITDTTYAYLDPRVRYR